MSHDATNWAVKQRGITPGAKVVLWHLADHHTRDHGCFPRQTTLCECCEMPRSTLNRYLNELESRGMIRRVQSVHPVSKRQMPTRYIFAFQPEFTQDVAVSCPMSETEADDGSAKPCPDLGHGAESRNRQKPCPKNGESRVPDLDSYNSGKELGKEKEEGAQAREADFDFSKEDHPGASTPPPASGLHALLRRVLEAVNHDPDGDLPHWWTGAAALTALERWRGFGLGDDQIVACAASSRKDNPAPPDGPKALDRAMQRFADNLRKRAGQAPVVTPEQAEAQRRKVLETYAGWVKEGRNSAATLITLDRADELLRGNLVTPQDMRRAGVRFRTGPGSLCARLFPEYRHD